ncbi:uncharacterized protein UDID_17531 [Ustilago sp. UG-2017a]|nr:uncharacterized protein UDID_17531 [Ustilago sp. UG-2017a]
MAPPNHSERIESLEDQVRSLLAALNARNTQELSNDSTSARQGFRSKEPEAFTGDTVNPPAWLTDYPLFINQLRVVFGDPDRIATAKREIEALSQTTSVANYLTQFRRLQMTLRWDKDTMACRSGKPTELETLIQRSLEIDNRIAERISEKKRTITRSANPTPMPASNPPIALTTAHPSSPSALHIPLTTAGKLDPEEYKRRQTNNLCIYYSQPPGNQYLSTSLCFLSPPSLPVHYVMIDMETMDTEDQTHMQGGPSTTTMRTELKEHADSYHSGARETRVKGTITGQRRRSSV